MQDPIGKVYQGFGNVYPSFIYCFIVIRTSDQEKEGATSYDTEEYNEAVLSAEPHYTMVQDEWEIDHDLIARAKEMARVASSLNIPMLSSATPASKQQNSKAKSSDKLKHVESNRTSKDSPSPQLSLTLDRSKDIASATSLLPNLQEMFPNTNRGHNATTTKILKKPSNKNIKTRSSLSVVHEEVLQFSRHEDTPSFENCKKEDREMIDGAVQASERLRKLFLSQRRKSRELEEEKTRQEERKQEKV
jgi:hypothetical protein